MYFSKLQNIFVQIENVYLFKLRNVFVQIVIFLSPNYTIYLSSYENIFVLNQVVLALLLLLPLPSPGAGQHLLSIPRQPRTQSE